MRSKLRPFFVEHLPVVVRTSLLEETGEFLYHKSSLAGVDCNYGRSLLYLLHLLLSSEVRRLKVRIGVNKSISKLIQNSTGYTMLLLRMSRHGRGAEVYKKERIFFGTLGTVPIIIAPNGPFALSKRADVGHQLDQACGQKHLLWWHAQTYW